MTKDNELFALELDVRWGDMDALGHVNNAVYFTYIEQARIAWMESLRGDWHSVKAAPVLARVECDFRRPLHHPARVRIGMSTVRVGNSSLTLAVSIRHADTGEEHASAHTVLVWVDPASGKPVPLPSSVQEAVTAE
jgi:acyl-CoA thioester hydrolase